MYFTMLQVKVLKSLKYVTVKKKCIHVYNDSAHLAH